MNPLSAKKRRKLEKGAVRIEALGRHIVALQRRLLGEPEVLMTIADKATGKQLAATTSQAISGLQSIIDDLTRRLNVEDLESVVDDMITLEGGKDMLAFAEIMVARLDAGEDIACHTVN